MRNKSVIYITQAAAIAAIYVVLTLVISSFNLASGSIQVRISEALCILPYFTPAAIPGLFIGCLIANSITGCVVIDVICGSLATLVASVCTYLLRKRKFLCTIPPVLANAIVVPFVLIYAYGVPDVYYKNIDLTYWFNFCTVAIGEIISVCIIGSILRKALEKYKYVIFKNIEEK